MISFRLNNLPVTYSGDEDLSLLYWLREVKKITSLKDGCSGQATCGACTIEIDGKARLACVTKMKSLHNKKVFTIEGIEDRIKDTIGNALVIKGAVQCGFCTPGILMRTKVLLKNNPQPTIDDIHKALRPHLCRCTGYKKIEDAIFLAADALKKNKILKPEPVESKIGSRYPKYQALETALGKRPFVNDLHFPGMLHAALKFSNHPRARVISIDTSGALAIEGVIKIFTADDIPGKTETGLIFEDWPLMIRESEVTHYIGDVLAGVVAETKEIARRAAQLIVVDYEILKPVTDPKQALLINSPSVHTNLSNLLETCSFSRGSVDQAEANSKYFAEGSFETQRIEHAFLETEAAVALPDGKEKITLYSQGQGIYVDRKQIASLLGIDEEDIRVILVPNGGGFGGKEDLTVQGHASLFAWLLKKPVKLALSREESIRMHPKRHPISMDIKIGSDAKGLLTFIQLNAIGDTGAYASVGNKVLERLAGHATGGYYIPNVDVDAKTVYTNNIPSGAMRGFGVPQIVFALESCIEELCKKGGFDPWQFRFNNALADGLATATGQPLEATGIRECLLALKDEYEKAEIKGLATGIKNCGVGNAMIDEATVKILIKSHNKIIIHHGWTEMGQGVHNMAIQTLCNETGLDPAIIDVEVDSSAGIKTGMTTSSRATMLVGNAIIAASRQLIEDLANSNLHKLAGRTYKGTWLCDWTTKPGDDEKEPYTHFAYGYAAQLCILDKEGNIAKIVAAHDAGKIMNPMLFEGQIEGAVHMGTGYAISEDLPMKDGMLISEKLKDCGVLRINQTPEIKVIGIEVKDKHGPYGAKGIGEIGLVPTAAAIACAYYNFDGEMRYRLPL